MTYNLITVSRDGISFSGEEDIYLVPEEDIPAILQYIEYAIKSGELIQRQGNSDHCIFFHIKKAIKL